MKPLKSFMRRSWNILTTVPLRPAGAGGAPALPPRVKAACLILFIGAAAAWTARTVYERIRAEASNRTVDICLDLDEVVNYCQLSGYPVADFLDRARAIGVSSIAVKEETIGSLARAGGITFFTEQDYGRLRLLDLAPPGSMVSANSLVTADRALAETLIRQLRIRYGFELAVRKGGKYQAVSPVFSQPPASSLWSEELCVGFSRDKIDLASARGFRAVLMPRNAGNPQWLEDALVPGASALLCEGEAVPGYPGKVPYLARRLKENGGRFVSLEFVTVPGQETLKRAAPECLLLGHVILPRELERNLDPGFWTARFVRAVRERGVRFILFHFWEQRPVEDNIGFLRATAQSLKSRGFALGPAVPPAYPSRGTLSLWLSLALAAAVFFPLWALSEGRKAGKPLYAYLAVNGITLAGGLFISALLFDVHFMQKIIEFPAVKAAMMAPLLLAGLLLYPPEKIRNFLASPIRVWHLAVAGAALAAVAVLLIRSGNSGAGWLKPDSGMRQLLEDLLLTRPRTKEFLIGQPLLFLGFYWRRPWLLVLGMIGQVSLINTFLHAHSPVMVSLVRSLHGIWLGLLIGSLAAGLSSLRGAVRAASFAGRQGMSPERTQ